MALDNLVNEPTPKEEEVVIETIKKGKKAEQPAEDLMKLSKAQLVDRIEAEELKYKKLKTSKTNASKEVKELTTLREQDAEVLEKMAVALGVANDEAASMSESLRLKNSTLDVVKDAFMDYIVVQDIAKRNLQKILVSVGISLGGGNTNE